MNRRMNRARLLQPLCAALVLATAAAGPSANAQPPPTAGARNPDDVKRAREAFLRGDRFYADQKWSDAEAAFLSAWSQNPTFDVASNLGLTQFKLGKFRDAAEHLAFALRHWPLIGPVARRQNAQEKLRAAKTHVATITVKVNVEHATVSVDGTTIGKAPLDLEIFVEPGRHTVEAKLDEHDAASQVVELAAGASSNVSLTLAKTVVAAPVVKGQEPDAHAKREVLPEPVPVVRAPKEEQPASPPSSKRNVIPGAVLGSVAGVALVTGIGLIGAAAAKRASASSISQSISAAHDVCGVTGALNLSAECGNLANLGKTSDTLDRVGVGVMVGGGAVAAGTLVYFLWPQERPSTATGSLRLAPSASTTGGGLLVSGTF